MKFKPKADLQVLDVAIPQMIENMELPSPELLTYYKNLEDRILWIDDEISEYSLEYGKNIIQWNKEDHDIPIEKRKKIKLLVFSPGGDLSVNQMLIDTITLSKTPIVAVNCGITASAACFIYLAANERYTYPNAEFMLHQGGGAFEGTYDIVINAIANYQRQIEELGEYILSRTSIPEDVFYENFSTDWYLTAKEAVDYGLCSKIITSLDEILE